METAVAVQSKVSKAALKSRSEANLHRPPTSFAESYIVEPTILNPKPMPAPKVSDDSLELKTLQKAYSSCRSSQMPEARQLIFGNEALGWEAPMGEGPGAQTAPPDASI